MSGSVACLRALVLPMSLLCLSACGDTPTPVDVESGYRPPELQSLRSVVLNPDFATVQQGDSLRLVAFWAYLDKPAYPVDEVLAPFLVWSTSDSTRATVMDDGLVMAHGPGFANIQVVLRPWPEGYPYPYPSPNVINNTATALVRVR